jgi:recombination protein RecA
LTPSLNLNTIHPIYGTFVLCHFRARQKLVSKKQKRLEAAVTAIQQRWGGAALQRGLPAAATAPAIPTGFAALDAALNGCGGIPRARLTELLDAPTSGMTTVALKVMAQAQQGGADAAYLDLPRTFDPDYAARCGVNLHRLLLVAPPQRPRGSGNGLPPAAAAPPGVAHFRFGGGAARRAPPTPTALSQLVAPLAQSATALLFVTPQQYGGALSPANYPPGFALPHLAALRLTLTKERWLDRGRDVRGYEARVVVLKNKLGWAAGPYCHHLYWPIWRTTCWLTSTIEHWLVYEA